MSHDPFITDLQTSRVLIDMAGTPVYRLPQYGIWTWDPVKREFQVAECHDDRSFLQAKYGVPDSRVFQLSQNTAAPRQDLP